MRPPATPLWYLVLAASVGACAGSQATERPAIGHAADNGARIVAIDAIDRRTRDLTIDSPSVGLRRVRLLLPARFDEAPSTRWPVLYLLHGADDPESYASWTSHTDVADLTAAKDLLVVMPEAGERGWYSDWWNDGAGGPPMWETFHLVEVRQLIERNWRASERRVVAGLSMGGYGAMAYAARHPGMFLAAASFSGAVDGSEAPTDKARWGDPVAQADLWRAHDPIALAPALKGVVLYIAYGSGERGPLDAPDAAARDDLEASIAAQNMRFARALEASGVSAVLDAYGAGTHSWPYWQQGLHRALPLLLAALGEQAPEAS